jgi:hypothetical protein
MLWRRLLGVGTSRKADRLTKDWMEMPIDHRLRTCMRNTPIRCLSLAANCMLSWLAVRLEMEGHFPYPNSQWGPSLRWEWQVEC